MPQQTAMQHTGPFIFSGVRFTLGALLLFIFSIAWNKRLPSSSAILAGIPLGLVLFAGISTQQIGIQNTTASNAGFITSLYLIFVPLQLTIFAGKKLRRLLWIGATCALIGSAMLCIKEDLTFNSGDVWVFVCTLMFTQYIILVDKLVTNHDPLELAVVQYGVTALCSILFAEFSEAHLWHGAVNAWREILFGGVVSVAFAYTAQLFAQQQIPPSESALIFGLEAIFAAWAGWYFLNEILTLKQLLGCGLMFTGMVIACLPPPKEVEVVGNSL